MGSKGKKLTTVRVAELEEGTKKLVLKGAQLRGTRLQCKAKDGAVTLLHINMQAILNADIRKIMEWDAPGQGQPSGPFLGTLHCRLAEMETGVGSIRFEIQQASDFSFSREFNKDGEPKREIKLLFKMITQGADQIGVVDQFFSEFGRAVGVITLSYTGKTGRQERIAGADSNQETLEGVAEEVEDEEDDEEGEEGEE